MYISGIHSNRKVEPITRNKKKMDKRNKHGKERYDDYEDWGDTLVEQERKWKQIKK